MRTFKLYDQQWNLILDFNNPAVGSGVFGNNSTDLNANITYDSTNGLTNIVPKYQGDNYIQLDIYGATRDALFKTLYNSGVLNTENAVQMYILQYNNGYEYFNKQVMISHVGTVGESQDVWKSTISMFDIYGIWAASYIPVNYNTSIGTTQWTDNLSATISTYSTTSSTFNSGNQPSSSFQPFTVNLTTVNVPQDPVGTSTTITIHSEGTLQMIPSEWLSTNVGTTNLMWVDQSTTILSFVTAQTTTLGGTGFGDTYYRWRITHSDLGFQYYGFYPQSNTVWGWNGQPNAMTNLTNITNQCNFYVLAYSFGVSTEWTNISTTLPTAMNYAGNFQGVTGTLTGWALKDNLSMLYLPANTGIANLYTLDTTKTQHYYSVPGQSTGIRFGAYFGHLANPSVGFVGGDTLNFYDVTVTVPTAQYTMILLDANGNVYGLTGTPNAGTTTPIAANVIKSTFIVGNISPRWSTSMWTTGLVPNVIGVDNQQSSGVNPTLWSRTAVTPSYNTMTMVVNQPVSTNSIQNFTLYGTFLAGKKYNAFLSLAPFATPTIDQNQILNLWIIPCNTNCSTITVNFANGVPSTIAYDGVVDTTQHVGVWYGKSAVTVHPDSVTATGQVIMNTVGVVGYMSSTWQTNQGVSDGSVWNLYGNASSDPTGQVTLSGVNNISVNVFTSAPLRYIV